MPKLSDKSLELHELQALDIRERCRMARLLQEELSKAPRIQKAGIPYPVLDEAAFRPQLTRLKNILSTMEFSETFHALLKARTIALADAVAKKHTAKTLRANWAQVNGRNGGDLQAFVAQQCRIFSGPGSAGFIPSRLDIQAVKWKGVRGYFNVASDDAAKCNIPPIVLDEKELGRATVQGCYGLAFHEQMHSILWQLGLAAYHDAVPKEHPLYNDAVMMRERIKYGVEFAPYMPGAYNSDPVEHACQHYEKLFMERCSATGLSGAVRKFWNGILSV